jgi:hypothetical protein
MATVDVPKQVHQAILEFLRLVRFGTRSSTARGITSK